MSSHRQHVETVARRMAESAALDVWVNRQNADEVRAGCVRITAIDQIVVYLIEEDYGALLLPANPGADPVRLVVDYAHALVQGQIDHVCTQHAEITSRPTPLPVRGDVIPALTGRGGR